MRRTAIAGASRSTVTPPRYTSDVIGEVLAVFEESGWRVSLCRSNFRPRRRYVEVERHVSDADEPRTWCVGFADDGGEAERLFDTTVRTVCLLSTGRTEVVDLGPGPGDIELM